MSTVKENKSVESTIVDSVKISPSYNLTVSVQLFEESNVTFSKRDNVKLDIVNWLKIGIIISTDEVENVTSIYPADFLIGK